MSATDPRTEALRGIVREKGWDRFPPNAAVPQFIADALAVLAAAEAVDTRVQQLTEALRQLRDYTLACTSSPLGSARGMLRGKALNDARLALAEVDASPKENACCEEHFPSEAMTPEEQAEHVCPNCGAEANPDWHDAQSAEVHEAAKP